MEAFIVANRRRKAVLAISDAGAGSNFIHKSFVSYAWCDSKFSASVISLQHIVEKFPRVNEVMQL